MSIKRSNSQSYIQNRRNTDISQRFSGRLTSKDDKSNTQILFKKSEKLTQSSKQKRQIAPDKLKLIRQIFTTISNNSQTMPIERLTDALLELGYDSRKDLSFNEFLIEHELNETSSDLLNFEYFALLVLEYEEKLRLEEEALRRLDLKIAFECFDINKDGMIDVSDLVIIMNILKFPINNQEAEEMIKFADHDKDSLLSFDEFLTVLTQISAMNNTL